MCSSDLLHFHAHVYNSKESIVIEDFLNNSDLLFYIDSELKPLHIKLIEKYNSNKKIIWCLAGFINPDYDINFLNYSSFLSYVSELYNEIPEKIKELKPYAAKEYFFDALLGKKRFHRDFIYKKYNSACYENKIFLNYSNPADKWHEIGRAHV